MKMAIINGNLVLAAETVDENFSLAEMVLEAGLVGKRITVMRRKNEYAVASVSLYEIPPQRKEAK